MRVLIVSLEYPPMVCGGLGVYTHHLVAALAARPDVEVEVLRPNGRTVAGVELAPPDVPIHTVPVESVDYPDCFFEFAATARAWVEREHRRFDVLHEHSVVTLPAELASVSTVHSTSRLEDRADPRYREAHDALLAHERRAWTSARRVVACSAFMRAHLEREYGLDPRVIPPLIDPTTFPFQPNFQKRFDVLFAGRDTPRKGLSDLIAALSGLHGLRVGILVDHTTPERDEQLRALEREHGHVIFASRTLVPHARLHRFYLASHLTVMPSRDEPFGLVAAESLSCGTPVLAYAEGGLSEVFEEARGGWFVDPGDVDALRAAVATRLRDATELRAQGREGAAWVRRRYGPAAHSASIVECYRSLRPGS